MIDFREEMKKKLDRMRSERITLRLYDMFDGWIDVKFDLTKDQAYEAWLKATYNGTSNVSYSDGDYYDVFPAKTRMIHTPGFRGR